MKRVKFYHSFYDTPELQSYLIALSVNKDGYKIKEFQPTISRTVLPASDFEPGMSDEEARAKLQELNLKQKAEPENSLPSYRSFSPVLKKGKPQQWISIGSSYVPATIAWRLAEADFSTEEKVLNFVKAWGLPYGDIVTHTFKHGGIHREQKTVHHSYKVSLLKSLQREFQVLIGMYDWERESGKDEDLESFLPLQVSLTVYEEDQSTKVTFYDEESLARNLPRSFRHMDFTGSTMEVLRYYRFKGIQDIAKSSITRMLSEEEREEEGLEASMEPSVIWDKRDFSTTLRFRVNNLAQACIASFLAITNHNIEIDHCEHCKQAMLIKRSDSKYCSPACRTRSRREASSKKKN